MCLTLNKYFNKGVKTAKKDIVCYKLYFSSTAGKKPSLISPYQHAVAFVGEEQNSNFTFYWGFLGPFEESKWATSVAKGLHSFKKVKDAMRLLIDTYGLNFTNLYVYKCIIPAGSHYYVGKYYDSKSYASDKLVVLERVKY